MRDELGHAPADLHRQRAGALPVEVDRADRLSTHEGHARERAALGWVDRTVNAQWRGEVRGDVHRAANHPRARRERLEREDLGDRSAHDRLGDRPILRMVQDMGDPSVGMNEQRERLEVRLRHRGVVGCERDRLGELIEDPAAQGIPLEGAAESADEPQAEHRGQDEDAEAEPGRRGPGDCQGVISMSDVAFREVELDSELGERRVDGLFVRGGSPGERRQGRPSPGLDGGDRRSGKRRAPRRRRALDLGNRAVQARQVDRPCSHLGCHGSLVRDRGLEPAQCLRIGREEVVVDGRLLGIHVAGQSVGRGPQVTRLAAVALDVESLRLREGIGEPNEEDRKGRHARNRDQKPVTARDPVTHGGQRRGRRVLRPRPGSLADRVIGNTADWPWYRCGLAAG